MSRRLDRRAAWVAAVPALAVVGAWTGSVMFEAGPAGLVEEVADREIAWLSVVAIGALLWLAGAALWRSADAWMEDRSPLLFALGASWVGLLLVFGSEFFYVEEFAQARLNTVFKLSFQAWMLLAIAGAYALFYLWENRGRIALPAVASRFQGVSRPAVLGLTAVVLAAGLVYPVISTANRTEGLTKDQTLNGLAYIEDQGGGEYSAVSWLHENVGGNPVIVEAPGPDWGENARISWRTGLPTIIGWPSHEYVWRGTWEPQDGREEDVNSIYISDDRERVLDLLRQYRVEYVVVGGPEVSRYGQDVRLKFDGIGEIVADFGTIVIYRVSDAALVESP